MDLQQQILTELKRVKEQNAEILKHLRTSRTDATMVTAAFISRNTPFTYRDLYRLRSNGTVVFVRDKKTRGYRYSWESILKLITPLDNGKA